MPLTTYEIQELEVGQLGEQYTVLSALMPREHYLEAVRRTIANVCEDYDDGMEQRLLAKLMPVAKTMPRFPIGTWVHSTRGCGCLVGEYLVATEAIDRYNAALKLQGPVTAVEDLLLVTENGDDDMVAALTQIGNDIDREVRALLQLAGISTDSGENEVMSVEFI